MKRTTVVCALLAMVASAGGCAIMGPAEVSTPTPSIAAPASPGATSASPSPKPAPHLSADQRKGIKPPKGYTTAPNAKVFDFAELSKSFYHCDNCTINTVVKKFGSPTKMFAELGQAADEWVELDYPAMTIRLAPHTHLWDKPNDVEGGKQFAVSSKDKSLPMSTTFIQLTDPGTTLPRALAIGGSSRTDVESAYPTDSAVSKTTAQLTYAYVWFKNKKQAFAAGGAAIGTISYQFDTNAILSAVSVTWTSA